MKINSLLITAAFAAVVCYQTSIQAFADPSLSLEQRVQQLEQLNQTRSQLQTQMSMQIIALEKEVRELRGIIEEHDYKLQQIQERQRDIYRDIDTRFNGLTAGSASRSNASSTNSTVSSATTETSPAANSAVTNSSGSARTEFEAAFKLVRDKKYDEAINAFETFLVSYPSSAFSDNARFWIGQVYFAKGNLADAEKHFVLLTQDFPQSSKLSAALLKMADIKVKKKQYQDAKDLYNQVLTKYSGAPQQLARKGLEDIKQAGF
jgi:tol-pal system protein YbgF